MGYTFELRTTNNTLVRLPDTDSIVRMNRNAIKALDLLFIIAMRELRILNPRKLLWIYWFNGETGETTAPLLRRMIDLCNISGKRYDCVNELNTLLALTEKNPNGIWYIM